MDKEKMIAALNTLLQINNDRLEGYETACKETEDADLKNAFTEFSKTSLHCQQELSDEIYNLGGKPTESTKITGKFFRVWMDVKAALTSNNRKDILDSCEYGEAVAKDTYKQVLTDEKEFLTDSQLKMIKAQERLLIADHNKVKSLRDSA